MPGDDTDKVGVGGDSMKDGSPRVVPQLRNIPHSDTTLSLVQVGRGRQTRESLPVVNSRYNIAFSWLDGHRGLAKRNQ